MKTVDAGEFAQEAASVLNVLGQGANLQEALKPAVPLIQKGIGDNFARQGSPDSAWPQRKNHGQRGDGGRSGYVGHPLLIDLGDLFLAATSGTADVRPRELDVHLDQGVEEYARVHNEGLGRQEQREFAVIDDARAEAIDELIMDGLERMFG